MAEEKQIKLIAASKEFNVGNATLVEFLATKGFSINASPMTKLTGDMYSALQLEFASDKKAKQSSEGITLSNKLKTKDEVVAVSTTPVVAPEVKQDVTPAEEPIIEKTPVKEAKEPKAPIFLKSTEEIAPKKSKKTIVEPASEETPIPSASIRAKVDGPNVVGKLDLDTVGKPKKGVKKDEKTAPVAEPSKVKPSSKKSNTGYTDIPLGKAPAVILKPAPELEKAKPAPIEPPKPIVAPTIENVVERKVLGGLKVMGKMVLPTAPESPSAKRKRKRISVDKKDVPPGTTGFAPRTSGTGGGGFNRPSGPGGNRGGQRGTFTPRTEEGRVIEQSEIQDKIKETLAKLGGGQKKGSQRGKYRKDKREQMAEKREALDNEHDDTVIKLTEFISVNELASLLNVSFADVIGKCMNMGMMVSINQRLDAEVIELVASDFGYTVEFINLEQEAEGEIEEEIDAPETLESRPPIVTIMGHVDHGKTSLLDYIRKANVIAGEAGGITQHIGAYEVTLENGKQITFLDTPGHEAFTAMRARGAKVTDLAIIVVAADDAVMPQTKEAISHAQAAGVPMIFALNKMDKDGANPQKIYEQLSGMNILVEEWGGKFQSQPIIAKTGENINLLLEKILLESDLLELKANPNKSAIGSVIEARLDKGRGNVATILVQSGTLRMGDMIVAGSLYGRVKAMYNERGGKMLVAGPSTPVQILGLNGAPQAGEKIKVYADEDEAKEIASHRSQIMREQGMRTRKHITLDEIGRRLALGNFKQLNVIIKGDVDGSVEALSDSLQKLTTAEVEVRVLHKGVGQITETDVNLAIGSDAIVIGFQVRPSSQAAALADKENIEIRFYNIIYDAINEIRSAMEGMLEPKIEQKRTCNIEIKEVYKITGVQATVAGCMVLDGKMGRTNKVNIIRDGIVVHTGELSSLKRYKDDVKEVLSGMECGLSIKNFNDILQGDIIEGFEEIEVKRTLGGA
jgi:translation initiation factor IF-2